MNEELYEKAILELLQQLGWAYLPPEQQPLRDRRSPLLGSFEEHVAACAALPCNRGVPREAVAEAWRMVESVDGAGLVE